MAKSTFRPPKVEGIECYVKGTVKFDIFKRTIEDAGHTISTDENYFLIKEDGKVLVSVEDRKIFLDAFNNHVKKLISTVKNHKKKKVINAAKQELELYKIDWEFWKDNAWWEDEENY
jgi:hypothetical protein